LSTVRRADRIVVLHHGQVMEEGPHAELLSRRALYAHLHDLQAGPGRARVGSAN
jgi:ABC-type multidrug transport system fused ATPase/permease subunit